MSVQVIIKKLQKPSKISMVPFHFRQHSYQMKLSYDSILVCNCSVSVQIVLIISVLTSSIPTKCWKDYVKEIRTLSAGWLSNNWREWGQICYNKRFQPNKDDVQKWAKSGMEFTKKTILAKKYPMLPYGKREREWCI